MPLRGTIYRITAVAILMLAAVELFACELLSQDRCEIAGAPSGDGSSKPADGDSCLCCCFHIVVSLPVELMPAFDSAYAFTLPECTQPSADYTGVYHPPRS